MPDEIKARCACSACRTHGLVWPVILIAVGVIFLAGQYTRYGFLDLWPVILIVAGATLVVKALASREGHVGP